MARLTDGNYYPQKAEIDYDKKTLTLKVEKAEFVLDKLRIKQKPTKIEKFDNPRKKLFVILVLIVLVIFIYSDVILLAENFLSNALLIVIWTMTLAAIVYYWLKAEYRVILESDDKVMIIKLDEQEKQAFERYLLEERKQKDE